MFFYGPDFLPLLVPRVGANDPHHTMALNDLALIAYFSYRNSYFHIKPLVTPAVYNRSSVFGPVNYPAPV